LSKLIQENIMAKEKTTLGGDQNEIRRAQKARQKAVAQAKAKNNPASRSAGGVIQAANHDRRKREAILAKAKANGERLLTELDRLGVLFIPFPGDDAADWQCKRYYNDKRDLKQAVHDAGRKCKWDENPKGFNIALIKQQKASA